MSTLAEILELYRNGFRSMVLGRTLWKIVIIKLIVMFGVLKLFFFPNYLHSNFSSDQDRAGHVLESITKPYLPQEAISDRQAETRSPGLPLNNHTNQGR